MSTEIRCRIGETTYCGPAITIEESAEESVGKSVGKSVNPQRLAGAIRRDRGGEKSTPEIHDSDAVSIRVETPPAPAVYDHIGCIRPDMGLRIRTALARAARTRGLETPYDSKLTEVREKLADLPEPESMEREATETVATTDADVERLRERVATARGRLIARRENDLDPTPAATDLADAITELSEAETTAAAARQRLERARETRREQRTIQEQRFRLEDRRGNLERKARQSLLEQVREAYTSTLHEVPGYDGPGEPFDVSPVIAALAIGRITDTQAPLVLSIDRFDDAAHARTWLETPVILIE